MSLGNMIVGGAILLCAIVCFAVCLYTTLRDHKANNKNSRR